ncbi:MAG: hypothetical protein JXB48_03420 [Candidatus Latescibacteria bacterium]|nr:hypothetical protein [Candidatus Latescibacterota bacterium]
MNDFYRNVCFLLITLCCATQIKADITIENAEMRLIIGENGCAQSLIHKQSGQECLAGTKTLPAFTVTQYRPYENELQLAYPAKEKSFAAESVRKENDRLIVTFELVNYEAVIKLNITEQYIGFTLEQLNFKMDSFRKNTKTPVDAMLFLQLPVRNRTNFGEWLNVMWDDKVAVNILATDPYAQIDSDDRTDFWLMQAGTNASVKLEGVGAALITTATEHLLDRIEKVEEDFNLPHGVKSRRSDDYKMSYYELRNVTTQNIDKHIEYARQGGFHAMVIYYPDFAKSSGHFPWRPEYPNGMADLRSVVQKIKDAGMTPGFHIHYNKANKNDPYVTPKPDHRLNLIRFFTLAESIDTASATIVVEENPQGCTLDNERRYLKFGDELITYENYTTIPPFRFTGCKRGQLGTSPAAKKAGAIFGLLDVDTWPIFVRFDQNTSIQDEVAKRLGKIYHEAGFQFLYFDGAEDTHQPYWYNVSKCQLAVYNACYPEPLYCEGACKSHFSWHMLSRGNAFDVFKPEVIKEATQKHQAAEAELLAKDFTSLDFGWVGYNPPGNNTIGLQPDMIEYVTSRAAAWDCPISLVGVIEQLDSHPRTADNLEIIRRWEEVRARDFLTQEQKKALRNLDQEHTLLIDENGALELIPYEQIPDVAGGTSAVRAFVFGRAEDVCVVYWHTSGEASIKVPLESNSVRLYKELGKEIPVQSQSDSCILPASARHYLVCTLPKDTVIEAFQLAKIVQK